MELIDMYRLLIGGYLGISEMDEYTSKEYILKEVDNYIKDFMNENPISNFNYQQEKDELEKLPLYRKLQDAILVLNKINGPLELTLLIREKLKELGN